MISVVPVVAVVVMIVIIASPVRIMMRRVERRDEKVEWTDPIPIVIRITRIADIFRITVGVKGHLAMHPRIARVEGELEPAFRREDCADDLFGFGGGGNQILAAVDVAIFNQVADDGVTAFEQFVGGELTGFVRQEKKGRDGADRWLRFRRHRLGGQFNGACAQQENCTD